MFRGTTNRDWRDLAPATRKMRFESSWRGNAQICVGLESGIEGVVHATRTLFSENDNEEEWGSPLVNTANAFNAGNSTACVRMLHHQWASSPRFRMNCYLHEALLLVRTDDGYTGYWLASQEEIT